MKNSPHFIYTMLVIHNNTYMLKDIINGKKTVKEVLSAIKTKGEKLDLPWK